MKTEENPYAAPQAPALTKAAPREGALWYVSEGVLHVRDGASLPDVCLSGASPGERGERQAFEIDWCPAWARYLPSVSYFALLIWVVLQSGSWFATVESPGFIVVLVAMFLPLMLVRRVSKRTSLHVFKADQAQRLETWRWWRESVAVTVVVLGGGLLWHRGYPDFLVKGGLVFMIGAPSSIIGILERRYQLRACEFRSGWFALTNFHPAAIARLAEHQNRLHEPPLSRNLS